MYVCLCKRVTDRQIRSAVYDGARSLRDVRGNLGVSGQCGRCSAVARQVISEALVDVNNHADFYEVA